MEEKKTPEKPKEKELNIYKCVACRQTYEVSEARRKEFACCGQRLTPFEIATKSDPTPFGP